MPNPRGMQSPGTLLQNRYRVLSQIGEGGMGAVYVATDERFGSTVALKETFFSEASLRRAFEREAQLLNRLRHPALPKVSDHFGESDGQFLVMEFIAGADLSEMLEARGGPFPAADVLKWADDLLDALDYLHTQEPPIVHRDIKPQNLKLTPRGHVVLLDFGLAKGTPAQTSQATKSVFGYSRNYAPLEQIQGTGTDFRSDLYSLGATLYHLLTNHAPADALTRAMAVLNNQPDPLRAADELNPQVSRAVGAAVARAMSQTAAARQQSAAEMREDLRRAAATGEFVAGGQAVTGAAGAHDARTTPMSSEQETRLFGAHAPGTTAPGDGGRETVRADEVAPAASGETTMVGGAATAASDAPTRVMHDARGTTEISGAGSGAAGASARGARSVASNRDGRSRIAVGAGAALGLVALLAGAFGVYKVTRQPAPNVEQRPAAEAAPPSSVPPDAPRQPEGAQTSNQNSAPALVQPVAPAPPSAAAAERRPSPARATERNAKREAAEEREGVGEEAEPGGREDFGAGVPENFNFNYNMGAQGMGRARRPGDGIIPPGIDWEKLTPEQRRRLTRRIRRGAMDEQQRALEELRRNQQRIPAPPPPRPRPVPTRQP